MADPRASTPAERRERRLQHNAMQQVATTPSSQHAPSQTEAQQLLVVHAFARVTQHEIGRTEDPHVGTLIVRGGPARFFEGRPEATGEESSSIVRGGMPALLEVVAGGVRVVLPDGSSRWELPSTPLAKIVTAGERLCEPSWQETRLVLDGRPIDKSGAHTLLLSDCGARGGSVHTE